jgi:hypothetical protein
MKAAHAKAARIGSDGVPPSTDSTPRSGHFLARRMSRRCGFAGSNSFDGETPSFPVRPPRLTHLPFVFIRVIHWQKSHA